MFEKRTVKEYILTALGTFITAFGIYYFLVPENLAAGGISGLSIVINNYIPIPISFINLILNVLLLFVGFLFVGPEFGGKTIFSIGIFSFSMFIMENTFPATYPVTDQILLNLICGITISAMGMSIVFNQNASTGGTDIVARLLNKYFNLDMGKGLMAADIIVVIFAFFTYGIKTGIVGAFGWFLNGLVINYFIDGLTVRKEVVIITKKPHEVKKFIFDKIDRGVTVYKAEGGYTNESKDIIVTILAKNEYFILKKALKDMDPEVFIIVRSVQEVIGDGFQNFN